MTKIKNYFIVKAIFLCSKIGAHRTALKLVNRSLSRNISLNNLRKAVSLAKKSNNYTLVEKYANEAIKRYPTNSFGYLEKANLLIDEGEIAQAKDILSKAPKSAATHSTLSRLKKYKVTPLKIAKEKILVEKKSELELAFQTAGSDHTLLNAIANQARAGIQNSPKSSSNYNILCKVLGQLNDNFGVISIIQNMPDELSSTLNNQMQLAASYNKVGNQQAAYLTLIKAQIKYPSERRILMRISDLLRDDALPIKAYSYIRAAKACYPEYGTVRQLSFEIDHNLINEARKSLEEVLNFPALSFMKFLPMINRALPYFDDMSEKVISAKIKSRMILEADKGRKGINPTEQIRVALKCRWLEEAKHIIHRSNKTIQPVSDARQHWFNETINNIGNNRDIFELASFNEENACLYGLVEGLPVEISRLDISADKIIELFIPTVFFAEPEQEKSSYKTVREFLSSVYSYLKENKDYVLVPRHQWNWRKCNPKIPGTRVLSYHTHDEYNQHHMHIQEAALAGRCTIDYQGFAGYSSLATHFLPIELSTKDSTQQQLESNAENLAVEYIHGNISKYEQVEQREVFEGNYVFVALQIPTDVVASLAYISGVDLVRTVAEFYEGTSTKVIVKRHPYCNSKTIQSTLEQLSLDKKIQISTASVHDLISGAQTVFTVNSGVGLEALLHKKTVVVTGSCDYAYAVAAQARTKDELYSILNSSLSFDSLKVNKLLHHYIYEYSTKSNDIESIKNKIDSWLSIDLSVNSSAKIAG